MAIPTSAPVRLISKRERRSNRSAITPPTGARKNGNIEAKTATATHAEESLSSYTTQAFPRSIVQRAIEEAVAASQT
jgi:hypothetical protein